MTKHQPQFQSLELRKEYKVLSQDGRLAEYKRVERMRANVDGIHEWWNRNIAQDGTISNILIDGKEPDLKESSTGTVSVCKRFGRALQKGEEITITLSLVMHDSFTKAHESVIHNNVLSVKEVSLVVEVPKPVTKAECLQTYSGEHGRLLAAPHLSENNRRIEAKIKKPRMGASYHIEWDW